MGSLRSCLAGGPESSGLPPRPNWQPALDLRTSKHLPREKRLRSFFAAFLMKVLTNMDDEIERLVVSVRADTSAFARDVSAMRGELEGPLATGANRAGRMIETSLSRAIVSGKLGFDDLKKVALSAMGEIAAASLRGLFQQQGGGAGAGLGGLLAGLGGSLLGLPGRATGGPVSQGRPYLIGERGPELFVPSSSGRVEPLRAGGGRDVRVSITVNGSRGSEPEVLRRSSRQVARVVRSAVRAGER